MVRYVICILAVVVLGGCSAPVSDRPPAVSEYSFAKEAETAGPSVEEVTEPNGLLTLRDALRLTLLNNPHLKAYSYEVRAAEARQLQAGLWANPELEVEVEDIGGSGNLRGFDGAETTIQLSQLIELGGKIDKRKKTYAFDSQLAALDYAAGRLDVSTALAQSFIELLFVQEKQALSRELIAVWEEVIDSVDKRVQAGKDSPMDLSKAKLGLLQARIQDRDIDAQVQWLRKQTASFWASRQPRFSRATGDLETIHPAAAYSALEQLLENNPDVKRHAVEVQKRKAEIELARVQATPDITIDGGIKHFNETDDTAFVFGLSIPLPVSDRNQGGRLEAAANLQKARRQQEAALLAAGSELARLHAALETAYYKAAMYRDEILKTAEEVFEGSKTAYEQGRFDYLTLLDAQRTYFAAQNDYLDAMGQYHAAKTELERLIGQSLETILMENTQ